MSGPADSTDVEIIPGSSAEVGAFEVQRVLPRRAHRTVGAWCFVDQMGPGQVTQHRGLDIGPHPHIGLQTVTWLLRGEVLHRDSLGSEQVIRPGQLNLMTAGHGVAHSEETRGVYDGTLHGVQLWVAQPEATRHGPAAFEHHRDLPQIELGQAIATVLVGELAGTASPARRDTDHMGADLALQSGMTAVALQPAYEHGLVVLDGSISVDGHDLVPGQLAYLAPGRDGVALRATDPTRVLLIGGTPFPDELVMWWNYVARTHAEVVAAHQSWLDADDRFGSVASPLERVVVSGPPRDS